MKSIFLFVLLMCSTAMSFAAEPNMPETVDPALGQQLQQIHQRGMQYKAGNLKVQVNPLQIERTRKALEATQCASFSPQQSQGMVGKGLNYCPHCGWVKCTACTAYIAAAVAVCAGIEDIPCIIVALGAAENCINCLVK